jgi:hypothetical protein
MPLTLRSCSHTAPFSKHAETHKTRIPETQHSGRRRVPLIHQVWIPWACLCRDTSRHAGPRFDREIRNAIGHSTGDAQDERRAR